MEKACINCRWFDFGMAMCRNTNNFENYLDSKLTHIKIVSFRKKFAVLLSNTTLFVLARLRSSYTVRHYN